MQYLHLCMCIECIKSTSDSEKWTCEAPSGMRTHDMDTLWAVDINKYTYFLLSLKKLGLSAWTITTSNRSLQSFPTM